MSSEKTNVQNNDKKMSDEDIIAQYVKNEIDKRKKRNEKIKEFKQWEKETMVMLKKRHKNTNIKYGCGWGLSGEYC